MTAIISQARQSERGFTLVELAIVMIIIGLLIGGILKGQELINNARVSSAVTQLKGVEAALNTFRDKYAALPGDIAAPANRLPNCTIAGAPVCATVGDGDSLIELAAGNIGAVAADNEGGRAFIHMAAAGVLAGSNVDPSVGAWAPAAALPDFNIGGNISLGYSTTRPTGAISADILTGHYLAAGRVGAAAMGTETIASSQAGNIDRKMDDGLPNAGSVRASGTQGVGNATDCASAANAAAVYAENFDGKACGLFVRVMN